MSAVIIAASALLALSGCVTTKVKMVGEAQPPISPEQVALYGSFPARFREIAFVEAHIYWPMFLSEESKKEKAINALAEAAAEVGADGLLIRNLHPASMSPFGYGYHAYRMGTTENSFSQMTAMHALAIATK